MQEPSNLIFLIATISLFLGVSVSLFLFFIKAKQNKANIFLGIIVSLYSLYSLSPFLHFVGILEELAHLIRLNMFSGSLVGPITLLYVKATTQRGSLKFKNNFYHFIPFILDLVYQFPFFLKTKAEKIEVYLNIINHAILPDPIFYTLSKVCLSILYTVLSILMVLKYRKHLQNTSSFINFTFENWLLTLSIFLLYPLFIVLIFVLSGNVIFSSLFVLLSISSIILLVYSTLFLKPKFFHKLENPILSRDELIDKRKYSNSQLKENQKESYLNRLNFYMDTNKPYLNPELSLSELSSQIDIPSNYLSQIINEKLNMNFLDFINKSRIEEVKLKFKDINKDNYTILAIAFESGFNSKSAFYSAFKKNVGKTPSAFRKALKSDAA